jgi:hypothetical protein
MLIVKGPWLPGFSDPVQIPETAESLTHRGYDDVEGGPALAYALRGRVIGEARIVADCFDTSGLCLFDPRNIILASCVRQNCKSSIWWMVEREGEGRWSVYAASWNETFGVLVLEASGWGSPQVHGQDTPLILISDQPDIMRECLQTSALLGM